MRKIALSLIIALFPVVLWAVKAYNMPVTITQSDGTRLTVVGHGDEFFSYYTTTDGALLFHDGRDFFIASIDASGNLMRSGMLAHEPMERTADETKAIKMQDRQSFYQAAKSTAAKSKMMREPIEFEQTLFPHEGTPKVLVLLVEFSDVKFTVNQVHKAFDQYFNAEELEDLGNNNARGIGSVSKYFSDISFGKFKPQFDVYGPVTLENTLNYYGENVGNRKDHMDFLIPDACAAVDENVDFSKYDLDNDGTVDLVYVIYAGYSESWGNPSYCIWPKAGTLAGYNLEEDKITFDGVKINRYGVNNELNGVEGQHIGMINGIAVFCHEFSHCMGMPDMYVTVSDPEIVNADNQEMEYWSIMDSGPYLRNGYAPPTYTAWERETFGWLDIETLETPQIVELKTLDEGGKAYRIMNDNDPTGNEYYIVENVQKKGWNRGMFGHGMLVTHVDYDYDAFFTLPTSVNNVLGHPRMTVLAADGCLFNQKKAPSDLEQNLAGDPFPGTSNVHELTDYTEVKPVVYTGEGLNKPMYNISEDEENGVVTFCFLDKDPTSINNAIADKSAFIDNRIYAIDGRCIGTNLSIVKKGVYIRNKKKVAF